MTALRVEHAFVNAKLLDEVTRAIAASTTDVPTVERTAASSGEALRALVQRFGRAGLLRFVVPGSTGGRVSSTALCLIRERLGHLSPLADLAFAMQGLGSYPLVLGGNDALKREWLTRVTNGDAVAAFALTEPNAGSDVAAMQTSLVEDGNDVVLNGAKSFISNAGIADFYSLFAVSNRAENKTRLSCVLLPANTPGLTVQSIDVLGAHPIGELLLTNVRVPRTHVLGAVGDGMKLALGTLERFRPTVGAAALGFATRALDDTVAHVTKRIQFGKPLSEQQLVQSHLAEMACDVESARLLVYRAAATADSSDDRQEIGRTGSMAKLMATEGAQRVIDTAVQLHGGRGVMKDTHVARLYEDIRALRIYEGATDIQKLLIAREILKG